ncbi:MAG: STAS domain-containing protein [Rhizomicrobium sp.]|nr:STAS domain-containing protein [Rhizomicrobium sp.]
MTIDVTRHNGEPVIRFAGKLTIDSVAAAKQELVPAVVDAGTAQLDLTAVEECDTAGVQLILMARTDARAHGMAFSARGQSPSFRAAAERVGVPSTIFEDSKPAE